MNTPRIRSPYGLIQEELRDQPWRLLVACIMLNLTSIKQVRPVISQFFERFPTADDCASASQAEIAELIKPLGLYNRRAATMIKLSKAFSLERKSVRDLPGVGDYAADSWRIFVDGKMDVEPKDSKLKKYIEWARRQA